MTNCRNCLIIRYFIVAVLVIILAALLFTDKMKYLSFINPEKISYLVIILGAFVFLFKLFSYLKKKSTITDKSDKIRNMAGKSTKSMSSKKVN
jgi:undecaprenyl pyrophosphate phosphatase UppP